MVPEPLGGSAAVAGILFRSEPKLVRFAGDGGGAGAEIDDLRKHVAGLQFQALAQQREIVAIFHGAQD